MMKMMEDYAGNLEKIVHERTAMLEETQRVYASAFERVPYPDVEDMKLGITQVSESNPRAKGADPKDFVDPRLLREIEASGFVKRLYGEGK